ncbi:unnamed protein product [Mesocestoides corti]|uniref:rRNA methyltransferase 1, mitochondrial n=1 Tax=Mesocestoides corti TaxID=53468 RepID=A0A3P6G5C3_MESCO|nr:unnamed protein product [Mesocestoides corti]
MELDAMRKGSQNDLEIIYGIQPTLAALSAKQRSISHIYVRDDLLQFPSKCSTYKNQWVSNLIQVASTSDIKIKSVPRDFLSSLTNGRSNQGVAIACTPLPTPSLHGVSAHSLLHFIHCRSGNGKVGSCCGSSSVVLFLDQVQDVMNVGSILRSAVFFGVPTVLFSAHFSASPSPLISKLSAGAMEALRFFRVSNSVSTLKQLHEFGFTIVGTAGNQPKFQENFDHSQPLELPLVKPEMVGASATQSRRPLVLVLGSESTGLSASVLSVCNLIIRIPGLVDVMAERLDGSTEALPTSLNVAAATAILLHSLHRIRA